MTFLEYVAHDFRAAQVIGTPDGVCDLVRMIPTGELSKDERTLVKDLRLMAVAAGLARSEADVRTDTEHLAAWESAVDLLSPVESPLREAKTAFVQILRQVLYRAPRIRTEGKSWEDFHAEDLSTILRVDARWLWARAEDDVPDVPHWEIPEGSPDHLYSSWEGYVREVLLKVAKAQLKDGTISSRTECFERGYPGAVLHAVAVRAKGAIRLYGSHAVTKSVAHYTGSEYVEVSAIEYGW